MEQRLVSAFGLCCYQLYEELGVCLLCGGRVVDWGLSFDDDSAPSQRAKDNGLIVESFWFTGESDRYGCKEECKWL